MIRRKREKTKVQLSHRDGLFWCDKKDSNTIVIKKKNGGRLD